MLLNRFGKFNINRFGKFNNYDKSTNVIDNFKTAQNIQLHNFSTMTNSDRDMSNRSGKNLNMPNYILNQKKYLFSDVMYMALVVGCGYLGLMSAEGYYITEKQKEEEAYKLVAAKKQLEDKLADAKKQLEDKNVINITLNETDMTTLAGTKSGCYKKKINGIDVIINIVELNANSENKK